MATIRSFTSLEQSRKLSEILPLESADMYYPYDLDSRKVFSIPIVKDDYCMPCIHCWSLAALFRLFPKSARLEKGNVTELYRVILPIELKASDWYVEPVDACYELILKLHELNLL